MQMLKVKKRRRRFRPLVKYKRAGLTDMHTDLVANEKLLVDPKDSDTIEM